MKQCFFRRPPSQVHPERRRTTLPGSSQGISDLLDSNEGRFLVTGPIWMLLDRSSLLMDPATGGSSIRSGAKVLGGVAEAGPFVVAFTDRDLAERFLELHPADDLVP